jgi:hypothetical protein
MRRAPFGDTIRGAAALAFFLVSEFSSPEARRVV